jgi:DNA-binding NarL/FixJ family response regulator
MSDSAVPLRVLVADDHPVFRAGMRQLLDTEPTLTCVAEAAGGAEAIKLATALRPDVAVLDLHMPGVNGVDAARAITREAPAIGVLMLTMLDDDESVFAAMRAGARGYLLKGSGPAEVVNAIHAVGSGAAVFGPSIAQRVLDYFATPTSTDAFADLTNREREILGMLADGHPNARIAERLHLSPKTVRNHVSSIFTKLHVADRAEAMLRARRAGLGQP